MASGFDDLDVPAAVVCMVCSRSDCSGCAPPEVIQSLSPWERGELALPARLWRTARSATVDGEVFFGGMADGKVLPVLLFAAGCELCAVASLSLFWLPLAYAFAPGLIGPLLLDEDRRWMLGATLALTVPVLASLMVALHLVWALGLELGLRLTGSAFRPSLTVRYALYSCGWDLITSPFGFVAGLVTGGPSSAAAELRAALRVPRSATRAYLLRARGASPGDARSAVTTAAVVTGSLVVVGAVALAVTLVVFLGLYG